MTLDPKALEAAAPAPRIHRTAAKLAGQVRAQMPDHDADRVWLDRQTCAKLAAFLDDVARSGVAPTVTDEMADRAIDIWLGDGGRWREAIYADDLRRDMRAALTAALFAGPVQANPPSPWQPIETAPKDGTRVLLASHHGVWMGEYRETYASGFKPKNPWFTALLNHRHMARPTARPTHWMPLPAPPAGEGV